MINCTHSEQKIFFWASVQIKVLFGLMGPPWVFRPRPGLNELHIHRTEVLFQRKYALLLRTIQHSRCNDAQAEGGDKEEEDVTMTSKHLRTCALNQLPTKDNQGRNAHIQHGANMHTLHL